MHLIEPQIDFARIAFGSLLDVSKDLTTVSLSFSEELEKIAAGTAVLDLMDRLAARAAQRAGRVHVPSPRPPPSSPSPWVQEMRALDSALPENAPGQTRVIKAVMPRARRAFVSRSSDAGGELFAAPSGPARSKSVAGQYSESVAASPQPRSSLQELMGDNKALADARPEPSMLPGTTQSSVPPVPAQPSVDPRIANIDPSQYAPPGYRPETTGASPAIPASLPDPRFNQPGVVQSGPPRRARMPVRRQAPAPSGTQPAGGSDLGNWYSNLPQGQQTAIKAGGLAAGTGLSGFGAGYLMGDG